MSTTIKTQKEILTKLGIEALNPMQEESHQAISSSNDVILLSPTGTGKTLAFLLPILAKLDPECDQVQVLILAPSRELAIQIEQVTREMGTGYKTNAIYGGRPVSKDKIELAHPPAVLVGTPGRIADHLRRETFTDRLIKTLVLDEFDKCLEIGFEEEMKDIISMLPNVEQRVLTSATQEIKVPKFVGLDNPEQINYLSAKTNQLEIKKIMSPEKDKIQTLVDTICHIGNKPGIIFCNFKDSIDRISQELDKKDIQHGVFYGGMEQRDRERALIKFRNGTHQILLATDLAARGIDVSELNFIVHYHLPLRSEEFTHRNGRTARMHSEGTAYVLQWEKEQLPDFIGDLEEEVLKPSSVPLTSEWQTLFVSGGRKDKISKGDLAGLFFKQGKLSKDGLGLIELKQDCAFVAVKTTNMNALLATTNNVRLKKKKVRVTVL